MAYVVTTQCIGHRHGDCVEACPAECFHLSASRDMLLIDPFECIDCGAGVPVCPEDGIFREEDVPAQWRAYIAINAEEAPGRPVIVTQEETPIENAVTVFEAFTERAQRR